MTSTKTDPLRQARSETERLIALQTRQIHADRIQRAVDAGIIDSTVGRALLDFWYPVP